MWKAVLLHVVVLAQAVVLFLAGLATLWRSSDLMLLLIHLVGEEYALGAGNVIHLEDGGTLLTNPSAMIYWTTPFWLLGFAQMSGAVTLVWLLVKERRRKEVQP